MTAVSLPVFFLSHPMHHKTHYSAVSKLRRFPQFQCGIKAKTFPTIPTQLLTEMTKLELKIGLAPLSPMVQALKIDVEFCCLAFNSILILYQFRYSYLF